MTTFLQWLTSPEWALIVKALLHSLWQGALIAGALALLLRRMACPTARYRLALSGLGVLLLATVVTWGVLNTPREPMPAMMLMPAPVTESALPPAATGPVDKFVVAAKWTPAKPQTQWTAWLALAWLVGAGVMLGRASVKIAGAEQLRRSCQPINDPRITGLVAEARRAVKLTRQIRVAVTSQLTSPAVVGVIVPTLILPLSLITTLSHEQLRFILLHELAHIRRGDYLANLFQLFAEALLFFNPAVWWLSHQVRREREACCDALAIELSGAPADYARTLVSVAETILYPSPAAAPAFGNDREPSSLADRVQRVLVPGYRPSLRLTWRAMLTALALGGVLLGLLAAGTRETIAATASLLEQNKQDAGHVSERLTIKEAPATNLVTRTFKVTELELARLVGDVGPVLITNTLENLQRFRVKAGFDRQLPGRALFFSTAVGLYVRGTAEEIDRVEKTLAEKFASSPRSSFALQAAAGRTETGPSTGSTPTSIPDEDQTSRVPETNVFTRIFKVDPNTFVLALESAGIPKGTNLNATSMLSFLQLIGMDVQPPKAVFFNDRTGQLFVRATLSELDTIEQALQVVNSAPPQVNIRARFIEVPTDGNGVLLGLLGLPTSNQVSSAGLSGPISAAPARLTGILTAAQAQAVFKALEQQKGVEILYMPEVTTLSGRQAQLRTVDIRTIVTGTAPLVTNGITTNVLQTSAMPFGPVLDVIPHVASDGYTVEMTIIPTVTEFVGYDDPGAFVPGNRGMGVPILHTLPLPHFRVRQATTQVTVWDGQTIVIGGFITESVRRQANGTETRQRDTQLQKKHLFVFITPTIIDPAGNRIHADDERPFSTNAVPRQPGR